MMRFIFWGLLGTVVLSPVPFGSIYPWSYTLMAMIVGVLVLLWAVTLLIRGEAPAVPLSRIKWPAILFGAVIVWCLIQASPWTPEAWHNPIWQQTAKVLGTEVQGYISVDPYATNTVVMRLLTYAGIFWLALQFGGDPVRARQVFHAMAIAGLGYAAYGLAVEFTEAMKVLWYEKDFRYRESLTSTFRYKNAYATYAGIGLLCTLALLVRALGREDFAAMGPRETLHVVITLVFGKIWYLVLGFAVIFSALLLSNSRGGFLATIAALLCFGGAMHFARRLNVPYGRVFVGAAVLAAVGFVAASGGRIIDELGYSAQAELRPEIFRITLEGISEHPILGWGAGTFEGVFAKFQSDVFWTRTVRAHNEFLDNALGMGIPATVALNLAVALLGALCVRGVIVRRRNTIYPATGTAAILLVALHSIVDFTLQVPAVAASLALVSGVACAQSWRSNGPS